MEPMATRSAPGDGSPSSFFIEGCGGYPGAARRVTCGDASDPLGDFGLELCVPLPELARGVAGREVVRVEDLANLDRDRLVTELAERRSAQPFDRLLFRLALPNPVPGD